MRGEGGAAFNKASDFRFSIAKHVFDQVKYDQLVEIRAKKDVGFDKESKFFPVYRAGE